VRCLWGLFAPFLAFVGYFLFLFLFGDPITREKAWRGARQLWTQLRKD
jgi:hypothetical protein